MNFSRRGWPELTPFLYRILVAAAYGLGYPLLARRYGEGLRERRGLYDGEKRESLPKGSWWVHAVSVGEVQTAWPLLEKIRERFPAMKVVLSTTTATGKDMAFRLAEGLFAHHIYYPWDVPWIVSRALDSVQPKAYIVMETEVWPNMLRALSQRCIPAFLVNGRFSERTARNIRVHPAFWRKVYDLFSLMMVRSSRDRDLLCSVGISEGKVHVTGDCKVDALLLRRRKANLSAVRDSLRGRGPVFLAGSTHQGEEEVVLEAFRKVRGIMPEARLILVPRHPERGSAVLALAEAAAPAALWTSGERDRDILVVDRIGVLFDLYGIADSAFIGGSLVDKGGQNIMEPASFGIPFSHGPFMRDFVDSAKDLGERGVARQVADAGEIAAHWVESMNPEMREKARCGAESYFSALGGAVQESLDKINGVMGA